MQERDGMRFVEVVLLEPEKSVVALADAYHFQPSLLPGMEGYDVVPGSLPPRRAKLLVYNKLSNEASIWILEFSEVHAATSNGGHATCKVVSSEVVPDVQPSMVCYPLIHLILLSL